MRLALACALLLLLTPPANADDGTAAGPGEAGFWLHQVGEDQASSSGASASHNGAAPVGPAIHLGEGACESAEQVAGEFLSGTFCPRADEPRSQPALTLGLIRSAFAELPLPAGTLVIQPPDGLTLVNFATNFYTSTTRPTTRTVTLLHRRVTLQATPTSYHWHFGDGSATTTAEPGAPYPRLGVTHDYRRTGTYRPRLDTTYSGRYRVGGGPWRTIPGTVTIDGEPQSLRAIEAEPKLVPY